MTAPRFRPEWVSFGSPAAIVTSMGLILGLDAAGAGSRAISGALLIVAIADNLSDSLSVHMYQEAERLEERQAFASTAANFAARLVVSLTFVAGVALLPRAWLLPAAVGWGFALLASLTRAIARARGAPVAREVGTHMLTAATVLVVSRAVGQWIAGAFA